jgi:hypothetical protein
MTEEILIKLANVNTVEELNAILAENNIALEEGVTPEAFLEALKADEELSEDALDDVAGGVFMPTVGIAATLMAIRLGMSLASYLRKYRK